MSVPPAAPEQSAGAPPPPLPPQSPGRLRPLRSPQNVGRSEVAPVLQAATFTPMSTKSRRRIKRIVVKGCPRCSRLLQQALTIANWTRTPEAKRSPVPLIFADGKARRCDGDG